MNDNRVLPLLRRLAKPGSHLAPVNGASKDGTEAPNYAVVSGRDSSGNRLTVGADEVSAWVSRDLIERCAQGYRLSKTGAAWLRRKLSAGQEFQAQHQARVARVINIDGIRRPAIVNDAESPLAWLASRKDKSGVPLLAPFQVEAGERLRADYQFAGLTARVTASWSLAANANANGGAQSQAAALQDNVMAARQRVVRALAAVGPELSGILVDVCCHLKGLEDAEKTEGWPQRSGKVILQIALTRLARHYGLVSDEQLSGRLRQKLLHWGAGGYRPKIGGNEAAS
ncbi:MAG: DUF6456 domain-containing protein [Rhodomicrobiaceae bacterium]